MKLWKSKKSSNSTTTSCVSVVSGKLNLNKNSNSQNNNNQNQTHNNSYNDDKIETISAASTATPTNHSTILGGTSNGLTQGE